MKPRIVSCLVFLFCFFWAHADSTTGQSVNMAEKVKITLQTISDKTDTPQAVFTTGESVSIRVLAHNQGDEQTHVILDRYKPYKPYFISLTRNGDLVEYPGEVKKALEKPLEIGFGAERAISLQPGEFKRITTIPTSYWYKTLESGNYELTLALDMGIVGKTKPATVRFTIADK